jgi:hypothetical protein
MGEYARHNGERIKIGTCEDMYYLRADQARIVIPERGNVDPIADAAGIRFRFPFPDEDSKRPGDFDDHDRGIALYGLAVPEGVDHGHVQFVSSRGFNVCLPCPESPEGKAFPHTIHRNGYPGPVRIVQQRVWEGHLALVLECGGCAHRWRCPELSDAGDVVTVLLDQAERTRRQDERDSRADWYQEIAARIVKGYTDPPAWVAASATVTA